jgi:hypothetical protein
MDYQITSSPQNISQRKLEGYLKLAEVIQWGRKYPVRFVDRFLGIELLDYQKYVFMMSWYTPFCVWLMSRNAGKTTLGSPYIMAKSMLVPNFQTYIMAGVGSQSQEMFSKIEKIAKKEISSFTGLTDIFYNETVKSVANTDGFTHNPSSFQYRLFNGAVTNSLNGDYNNNRSKRSNLNFYDESGFAPSGLFEASMPFITQNSDFRLGGDVDVSTLPKQFPNQAIFASSASSTDTYFYRTYKDYAKKMFLGDKRFFVADINCEIVIKATYNGKLYPVSLLTQDVIDGEMRKNKDKALREYYNKFEVDGGDNQVFKRATIVRNSEVRLPILYNNKQEKRKFVIAYDPAHQYDNSVCLVGEIIYDEKVGEKLNICNGVSFVDIGKKKKTPMRTPEQIALLKQMILDYNGKEKADYENIECLLIDAGAGGHGTTIADYLMEDWVDSQGIKHKGLIDRVECLEHVSKFPNAVDKLKLMSPQKYKKEMFDALVEMINLDLITFTEEYDLKGYLMLPKVTDRIVEFQDEEGNVIKDREVVHEKRNLDFNEELALKNIDIAKEEIINTYRYNGTNGNYRYDLSQEKANELHDDRAYCLALLGWYLQQVRRKNIVGRKKPVQDITKMFQIKAPKIRA